MKAASLNDKPWVKVVTHPLGLVAYALASVFGLFGILGPIEKYPWLLPTAVALAIVVIIAGLVLAYRRIETVEQSRANTRHRSPSAIDAGPSVTHATDVELRTSGAQSPNVVGNEVKINYGASTGDADKLK